MHVTEELFKLLEEYDIVHELWLEYMHQEFADRGLDLTKNIPVGMWSYVKQTEEGRKFQRKLNSIKRKMGMLMLVNGITPDQLMRDL